MNKSILLAVLASFSANIALAESKPTDAQIAAIVVAANQVDIDAAKFALSRTNDAAVKEFANMMVTDHASVNQQAVNLVTKLKVTPEENASSKDLVAGGKKNIEDLGKLSGKAFDKAYVDHEVAYHEAVIGVIKNTLIPSASNEELKGLLVKSSPAFLAHLDHAKHLQTKLSGK